MTPSSDKPAPKPIRVLVADDHPLMREGIAAAVNAHPGLEVVATAADGREALEEFLRHRPDISLIDLQMPLMSGLEAISAIRSLVATARIIVLTTYKGDVQIARAIQAGASGYLLKSMLRTALVDAIFKVHGGAVEIPLEVAQTLATYAVSDTLSAREIEVLRLVAIGNSNKLVGAALSIAEETVKAHMSTILSKLGANDRTHAVTIAIRRGIIEP